MPTVIRTWNHKHAYMTINGMAITDVNGDITVSADSELWEFIEGQNGSVERSLLDNHMASVSIPFMATTPQLDIIAAMDIADRTTNAGPYLFTYTDTDRNYKLFGQATIMSIAKPTRSKTAQSRTVNLKVVMEAEWPGA